MNRNDYHQTMRRKAEQGDPQSMYHLAIRYDNGVSPPKDSYEAIKWCLRAAAHGNAGAMHMLGHMYDREGGDRDRAIKWHCRAAAYGHVHAMNSLGYIYEYHNGGDHDQSVKWYRRAAERGDEIAMCTLGRIYNSGIGLDLFMDDDIPDNPRQDYNQSIKWYLRAAEEQGSIYARRNLGEIYKDRNNPHRDYTQSIKWYRHAAYLGDTPAMYALGEMYKHGDGVPRDYKQAINWYRRAAGGDSDASSAEDRRAMRELAKMHKHGEGVLQDYNQAIRWYRCIIDQEDDLFGNNTNCGKREYSMHAIDAMYNLCLIYEDGNNPDRDRNQAIKWCRRAAEHEHVDAEDRWHHYFPPLKLV